jgi:PhzF family phenazine biosynthesis protein
MELQLFQVDAFSDELFRGNPAAVCPLQEWLPDEVMQAIARENNLSETAFYVRQDDGFGLRWFTPATEVDLCGHATLATAHVLLTHKGCDEPTITFHTNSGELSVRKKDDRWIAVNFPAKAYAPEAPPLDLYHGVNGEIADEVYIADDFMLVFDKEEKVHNIQPNFSLLSKVNARGIIVTAPGNQVDFVSRFFAPSVGVNEDPVTGSAHTMLIPYWANRLHKKQLTAAQVSPRGGSLKCKMLENDRVEIAGRARTYLKGVIEVPDSKIRLE